jgi:hypothetical protein
MICNSSTSRTAELSRHFSTANDSEIDKGNESITPPAPKTCILEGGSNRFARHCTNSDSTLGLFVCNHIVFSHVVAMTNYLLPSPPMQNTSLMGRILWSSKHYKKIYKQKKTNTKNTKTIQSKHIHNFQKIPQLEAIQVDFLLKLKANNLWTN